MRRLLPLIVVLALAIGTADAAPPRRKRVRPALEAGPSGSLAGGAAIHAASAGAPTTPYRAPVEPLPCGAFNAATGTLTWFEDELYN
ncbi:MAG TPA: hypothetical protein VFT22_15730 [Kofleriaceae bacterium]|nr:hypothetical protein [Kofleriaceae bacterium]